MINKKIKQFLRILGLNFKQLKQIQNYNKQSKFSSLDEEKIIDDILQTIDIRHNFFVDIGAANGVSWSNSCQLALKGWQGLSVEYESESFAELAEEYKSFSGINLSRCMVTPENVISLLKGNQVPQEFGFLSLDIDSYDYYVLEQILKFYRPSLICTEINQRIPPPIKFTVEFNPDYAWSNRDSCTGQSISQLNILLNEYNYGIVDLEFNNAFVIPKELGNIAFLSPEEAFRKGFLERPDRKQKFPWGQDMEEIYSLSTEDAVAFIKKAFRKYEGKFICEI